MNRSLSISGIILLKKRNTDFSGRLKKIKTAKKQPKWYMRQNSNRGNLRTLPLSYAGHSANAVQWTYLTQVSYATSMSLHAGISTSSAYWEGYIWLYAEKNKASLTARREQLARNFFDSTVQQRLCLHHLPPPRDLVLL